MCVDALNVNRHLSYFSTLYITSASRVKQRLGVEILMEAIAGMYVYIEM